MFRSCCCCFDFLIWENSTMWGFPFLPFIANWRFQSSSFANQLMVSTSRFREKLCLFFYQSRIFWLIYVLNCAIRGMRSNKGEPACGLIDFFVIYFYRKNYRNNISGNVLLKSSNSIIQIKSILLSSYEL